MSASNYTLPPTARCPGCGTLVVLPAEPLYPDSPPAICATCDTEVPDYRRESFSPSLAHRAPEHRPAPPEPPPLEHRRYSRGGLLRSLGGILAERGVQAVEDAKGRFTP
jgi:hypothetical protein